MKDYHPREVHAFQGSQEVGGMMEHTEWHYQLMPCSQAHPAVGVVEECLRYVGHHILYSPEVLKSLTFESDTCC